MTKAEVKSKMDALRERADVLHKAFVELVGEKQSGILAFHASMAVRAMQLYEYAVIHCFMELERRTDEAIDEMLKSAAIEVAATPSAEASDGEAKIEEAV